MLDYAALSALAAVIREGSFERAARALHVTPSAISQRIRQFEERVGCALVIRGQPCIATDAGRRLCQHMDRVRLLEQDLKGTVPNIDDDGAARVALPIAVSADCLATWLGPVIADYGASAPVLMEVTVDDQDYTGEWLRTGAVLAAVTGSGRAVAGCDITPLGAMRYLAVASPAFMQRFFADGVDAASLAAAPSLVFNAKDALQERWVQRLCGAHVALPRHCLPSPQAFVTAALAGMGWGMHAESLVKPHLASGTLVELVPSSLLDVPLYWQAARAASIVLDGFNRAVLAAARSSLQLN
jgi:LysR family transcriptional regulator (chromosome initiation inhibitor)